ncbi:MAG: hypothetical protein AAGJ83_00145 [Planctomycetota bacterium]
MAFESLTFSQALVVGNVRPVDSNADVDAASLEDISMNIGLTGNGTTLLKCRPMLLLTLAWIATSPSVLADQAVVRFDVPAVVAASSEEVAPGSKQVTAAWTLSSLVVGSDHDAHVDTPPIDHLLIRCRLRERFPVVAFLPRTEVQTDYAGPISITEKREKSEAFGVSMDGKYQPIAGAHLGADETSLQSNATQYQHNAPVQAVVASGTIDRGHGVYFKLRWTRGQVLEGEKHFQVTFTVPRAWRGGLLDVEIMATGIDRGFMGKSEVRPVAQQEFVIAVHDEADSEAATLAGRLAVLDKKLRQHAQHSRQRPNALQKWWNERFSTKSDRQNRPFSWYQRLARQQADPYIDQEIRRLPMPVRVTVIDYAAAVERLAALGDSS